MKITTFVFNPFQVNTYLLFDSSGECIIIDAGCYFEKEYENIYEFISSQKLKPVKLINTHAHIDHILGIPKIAATFNLSPSFHKNESYLFSDAVGQGKIFGLYTDPMPAINNFLEEGINIKFGNSELEILHVPGHTPGSVIFVNKKEKIIITGDTLFKGSVGRTDLPGGNFNILMNSIKYKILLFEDDFKIYPGHGPSSTIGEEKHFNPFLT